MDQFGVIEGDRLTESYSTRSRYRPISSKRQNWILLMRIEPGIIPLYFILKVLSRQG
ncbi:unnamed protein product [Meloidogyne enterolobii]|uniref:Uncharacterized protein n=1 Tax=Meloidogyne enterolobii TaxID=390850 RepID=A0ACB0YJP4_MELEN